MVFAPHPDDEVLGCGGTIAKKVVRGSPVRVVILTDGRTSHSKWLPAEQLVRMRREEAAAAGRELGLPEECYEFLDFPDGELELHQPAAIAAVRRAVTSFAPAEIYVPHRRDKQPDHLATYRIVRAALTGYNASLTVIEYPVWLWHSWPWTWGGDVGASSDRSGALGALRDVWDIAFGCRQRSDISSVRDRKVKALAEYRSQMERLDGNPSWPIMRDVAGGEFLQYFLSSTEFFRVSQYRPGRI
jgi:LmbE family N-acetylglucosaminyl deacetylase